MTKRLEEAFAAISKLPDDEQDTLAAILLDELAAEQRWTEAFAKSQDQLSRLADEALTEYWENRTELLDTDQIRGINHDN